MNKSTTDIEGASRKVQITPEATMTALEMIKILTEIHSELWRQKQLRSDEMGVVDDIALGLGSCATYVGDAAQTLSNMQSKMTGHYALQDMLTGNTSNPVAAQTAPST